MTEAAIVGSPQQLHEPRPRPARAAELVLPQTRPHRPQWLAAYRALRRLLDEPGQTQYAFEVIWALDGDSAERGLQRMLRQPQGRELFLARPQLIDALADRERLQSLPVGSFGRAYLEHIDRYDLDPGKLVRLSARPREDAGIEWFAARQSLMHDLWHVLTGCGADGRGEAELLAFSFAQNGGRANLLLTLGASSRMWGRKNWDWPRVVWRSYRRGRNARLLAALPYEELLPLPLDEVRRAAGVVPDDVGGSPGAVSSFRA